MEGRKWRKKQEGRERTTRKAWWKRKGERIKEDEGRNRKGKDGGVPLPTTAVALVRGVVAVQRRRREYKRS